MWKHTAISYPSQVPSSIPCPSCGTLFPALPLASPESLPLPQSSQPLFSPKTPLGGPAPLIGWESGWASYLRIEADLTDITGNDGPLGLEQGSPKSVREHSLLHRVHLWRQAGVSQEPQHKLMSIIPPVAAAGLNESPQSLLPVPYLEPVIPHPPAAQSSQQDNGPEGLAGPVHPCDRK